MSKDLNIDQIEAILSQAKDQPKLQLSADASDKIRAQLMTQLDSPARPFSVFSIRKVSSILPMSLAVVLAIGSGMAAFANTAKPGDFLYPLDRLMEQVEVKLVRNPEVKAQVYASFNTERTAELEILAQASAVEQRPERKARLDQAKAAAELNLERSLTQVVQVEEIFKAKLEAAAETAKARVETEGESDRERVYRAVLNRIQVSKNRSRELVEKLAQTQLGNPDQKDSEEDQESISQNLSNTRFGNRLSQPTRVRLYREVTQDFRAEYPRTDEDRKVYDILRRDGKIWGEDEPDQITEDKPSSNEPDQDSDREPCEDGLTFSRLTDTCIRVGSLLQIDPDQGGGSDSQDTSWDSSIWPF